MMISEDINTNQMHDYLVQLVKKYNTLPSSYSNKKSEIYRLILNKSQKLGYQLSSYNGAIEILSNGKPIRTISTHMSSDEIQNHKTLNDYADDFQNFTHKLINLSDLSIQNLDVNSDLNVAQRDILKNKKSVSANRTLDALENMYDNGVLRFRATKHSPSFSVHIDEYFEEKEEYIPNLFINDDPFGNGNPNLTNPFESKNNKINKNKRNTMNLTEGKLIELVEKITAAILKKNVDETQIEESTYEFSSDDPQLQAKSTKLQSDTTLFNKDTDEIKITNPNESKTILTKNQIMEMMAEAKAVRDKNGDYVKAIKKADREMEFDEKGPGFKAKDKAHKNIKKYDRKTFTKNELIEMLTKK